MCPYITINESIHSMNVITKNTPELPLLKSPRNHFQHRYFFFVRFSHIITFLCATNPINNRKNINNFLPTF